MMGYHSPTFCLLLCSHFISVLCSSPSPTHLCSPNQSAALFQFKTHFSINQTASKNCEYSNPKAKTTSLKKGTDCCLWDGVSCDNITGEVISLDLSCSCLSGTFPSNTTFFLLSSLQRLDLSFNDFRKSEISSNFGRFPSSTHLDLSYLWFSGLVPYEISYLSNLVSLHLSYRPTTDLIGFQAPGPILKLEKFAVNEIVRNLTKVREIYLDGIDMSSIDPNSFVNLSYSLTSLSLFGCHLRGKLPDNIFKLPNIEYLRLDENPKLTGQFPKSNWSSPLVSLRNLSQLDSLYLSFNYFSGKIPSSLTNPAKLSILTLNDNQLEGFLPDNQNAFPNLALLDLSNNLLSGTTPSWLYTIPRLLYLNLGNNQFNGHISEFQNRLLIKIILKDNSFRGPIPSSISKLVDLTSLDLSSNELNGTISLNMFSELQNLKKLDVFDLHSNFIEGDLPKLPPNIRFLSVSNNSLVGTLSGICNMKFIEILDLSHNDFSGIIPQCIGSFSQSLSSLNLKMNKLHGAITSIFAKGRALKNLNLNSNHLEGPLTPSITNCKELQVLDARNNMVNDSFPHWIEALSELQVLVLRSNRFHGPITAATSPRSLLKLRIVDLSCNNFFVPLPTAVKGFEIELVKILTIFTSIDLSCNNFEGQIPRDIGELSSLRGLNLSHNNLVGHIPSSLRNMTRLEWLDLSSNKLSGQIQTGLLDLTFLSSFNVSCNQLVGPIPKGKQFNTFENGSYQGNVGLCGVPLSRGCNNNVLGQPPLAPWMNSHEDDGSKLEFGWKVVAIGYGFGFIFGAAMGCGCLRAGVGV
ncbi:hypothetical protein ES288_A01G104800v1 [Gossypium darwinii]|uniref:Leucine-rich repeat-containing N-terminal plant-type domain-containing protein n=1 Tax=Gossypium darwinii TaxID=34276 RepID=A0A5D2HJU2_GOSDA|nr:hypothetical protein ES288_A01G104800v1 [Gossypium darwinii]